MGLQEVAPDLGPGAIRAFTKALLEDLRALEDIIDSGMIETDIRRIGDGHWGDLEAVGPPVDRNDGAVS